MTAPPLPMASCCRTHHDWETLARHLIADFDAVPIRAVIDELTRAQRAGHLFDLAEADAIHCAELLVRHRLFVATGSLRGGSAAVPAIPAAARVA